MILIKNKYLDRLIFFAVLKNYFDETIKYDSVSLNVLIKKPRRFHICGHNYFEVYTQDCYQYMCERTSKRI